MSELTTIPSESKGKSASVREIARLSGISVSAVYKSLRDDSEIGADTRERVRMLAGQLNYRPQASARALKRGRTDMVCVTFSGRDMQMSPRWIEHYAVALEGISEVLEHHDYATSLVTWSDEKQELRLPRLFRESGVDGLIVLNTPETPLLEQIIARHGKPYVALDAAPARNRVAIAVDEVRAAEMAVEHLVGLGHRRIAYFPSPIGNAVPVEFTPLRVAMFPRGYVRAMAAAGLAPIPGWDYPQEVDKCVEGLLKKTELPTAFITYDDSMALSLINLLKDRGLSVPKDASVVALQYTGLADKCALYDRNLPGITCKANLQNEMAKVGVEKLLALIEHPDCQMDSTLLKPAFDVRTSTGPVRAS